MKNLALICLAVFLFSGCAVTQKPITRVTHIPEPLEEIHQPKLATRTPGSLWSSDDTSIFADHKARNVGDIIVVTIDESDSASKEASTTTGGTSTYAAGISNLFGLEKSGDIKHTNLDLGNLVNTNFKNGYNSDNKTARNGSFTGELSVQVIGKYPNGNLKIRGGKEVRVNNENQIIYLTGIIRPVDITADNTIDSNKILNAQIAYTGKGVLSDQMGPGWLGRIVDILWPF